VHSPQRGKNDLHHETKEKKRGRPGGRTSLGPGYPKSHPPTTIPAPAAVSHKRAHPNPPTHMYAGRHTSCCWLACTHAPRSHPIPCSSISFRRHGVAHALLVRVLRAPTETKLKVAINGFGRIGRNFLRCWHGREDSPLDIVAINDTGGVKQASHLLKYDSMLGIFDADVKPVGDGKVLGI
jgi:hypothetical protein